jgi:tetratricopeptide (TPR) repeat protein
MSALFDSGLETARMEEHIRTCRMALLNYDVAPAHTKRIDMEEALAGALMAMHDITYDIGTLQEAIFLYERILDVGSAELAHRAQALTDLGHALWRLCEFHDEDAVRLRQSIGLLREALDLCPVPHPAQTDTFYALGLALHTCFKQLGDIDDLSGAIALHRDALRLRPLGHPLRADSLHALACALIARFDHQGGMDTLTEVIRLLREALHLRLPGDPRRVKSLNNLANALHTSFEQHGGQDAMADAIALHREVLELRPIGHPLRAQTLSNLAYALHTGFKDQGGVDALAEATALCREALHLRPPGHNLRGGVLSNLADILFESFQYQGNEDALSEAIQLRRETLSMLSSSHFWRSEVLDGLARTLQASFEHRGSTDSEALQEVIALHREALTLRPVSHPYRDDTQHQLAMALESSYQQHRSPGVLAEAITLYRDALVVRVSPHPGRHLSLMGLASSLSRVAIESKEDHTWRETVSLYEEALALCPRGHPMRARLSSVLGRCLLMPTSAVFDFDLGVGHLLEGFSDGFAPTKERLQNALEDLRAVEKALAAAWTSNDVDATVTTQTRRCYDILRLYQLAIQLLPRMANFGMNHQTRYRTLMGSDEISRTAATRAILLGRVAQAVEMLEEGRGMFWAQALRLRTSGLDEVPEVDRADLQRLFRALDDGARSLTSDSMEQSPAHRERRLESQRQLNLQAEAVISRIRSYNGLHRFLMPAAFDTLLQTLPDGFVIIINASPLECHALLLTRDGAVPEILELPVSQSLVLETSIMRASLPRDADYTVHSTFTDSRAMRLSKVGPQDLEDLLATLWTAVVGPIVHRLGLQVSTLQPSQSLALTCCQILIES